MSGVFLRIPPERPQTSSIHFDLSQSDMPAHLSLASISALPFRDENEQDPSPVYSSFPASPAESVCSLFAKSADVPLELDADAARRAAASSIDLNVCLNLVNSGSVDKRSGKGLRERAVIIEEERKRREYHSRRIKQQRIDDERSGLPSYGAVTGETDFEVRENATQDDPFHVLTSLHLTYSSLAVVPLRSDSLYTPPTRLQGLSLFDGQTAS